MRPAIAANSGHEAYFYCYDDNDADVICAFQQYKNAEAASDFLATTHYAEYTREVEPLLAGPPQVTTLTSVWVKPALPSS